jgi:hypothetical protein
MPQRTPLGFNGRESASGGIAARETIQRGWPVIHPGALGADRFDDAGRQNASPEVAFVELPAKRHLIHILQF